MKKVIPSVFAVQANASSTVYQSELRCVIVTVSNIPFIVTPSPPPKTSHVKVVKLKIKTSMSLKDNKMKLEKAKIMMKESVHLLPAKVRPAHVENPPGHSQRPGETRRDDEQQQKNLNGCQTKLSDDNYVVALNGKISTSLSLENDYGTIVKQVSNFMYGDAGGVSGTESFTMLLFALVAIIGWTEAGYYGTVFSHTTKDVQGNTFTVVRRVKLTCSSCAEIESWWSSTDKIEEISGEWCLKERTQKFTGWSFNYYSNRWDTPAWINNRNGVSSGRFRITYELRKRSDINRPNSSPQTGIIPLIRVPSNCQRDINLLTFDPDGDNVQCRYGSNPSEYECYNCTAPSVLSLSSACSLSFSPTNSSNEGSYAVQLMMEDFPRWSITLTHYNGSTYSWRPSNFMSRIPVQFVFKVDPAAPSCTAGEYLPRFLPPTPEHGAQFFIDLNEKIEISIRAEATQSVITGIQFSGPFNMAKSSSGSEYFTLRWTPSVIDDEESHPICFAVQATTFHSDYNYSS
ncbi:uncharacterized protein LOC129379910 [Poeciliopsis prolifica]|uniref:uncharacterized protein LOC129379910 n=1 Tax=Poeciliopsis prolifica TaxID=188132 RepID=UPI00241414A2|nr:uncharacterized protein LOC129379910 [Poeciliopsis prolifica]